MPSGCLSPLFYQIETARGHQEEVEGNKAQELAKIGKYGTEYFDKDIKPAAKREHLAEEENHLRVDAKAKSRRKIN